MRTQYPKEIDAWSAADRKKHLSFKLEISQCKRLESLLANHEGFLDVVLDFSRVGRQAQVLGTVKGRLSLICQRCLSAMDSELSIPLKVVFVINQAQIKALDDRYDPMLVNELGMFETLAMIEDEMLLSLPAFPKHRTDCQMIQVTDSNTTTEQQNDHEQPARENPFAILAQLKK